MILNVNLNANNKTFFLVSSKTLIVEVHKSKTHIFSPKKSPKHIQTMSKFSIGKTNGTDLNTKYNIIT